MRSKGIFKIVYLISVRVNLSLLNFILSLCVCEFLYKYKILIKILLYNYIVRMFENEWKVRRLNLLFCPFFIRSLLCTAM